MLLCVLALISPPPLLTRLCRVTDCADIAAPLTLIASPSLLLTLAGKAHARDRLHHNDILLFRKRLFEHAKARSDRDVAPGHCGHCHCVINGRQQPQLTRNTLPLATIGHVSISEPAAAAAAAAASPNAAAVRGFVRVLAVGLFGYASVHQRRCHAILKALYVQRAASTHARTHARTHTSLASLLRDTATLISSAQSLANSPFPASI